ncbi:MAG: hypothetical protein M1834_001359 [Cirrosporium novae-zelandiae]|nr:MAG: hypothetical protein M1834_001359 [Cirrosporium novae-zelandiae]
MSFPQIGPVKRLWYTWKSMKLPWRKRFLVGMDLAGNTFWEFKDTLNSQRLRRIVKSSTSTHYADVKISPQWHQWLRYIRPFPPTLSEQQADVARQAQLKKLAQLADQRWAEKPSYLDMPKERQQLQPATHPRGPGGYTGKKKPEGKDNVKNAVDNQEEIKQDKKDNPWARERGLPGENWQPEAWNPDTTKR